MYFLLIRIFDGFTFYRDEAKSTPVIKAKQNVLLSDDEILASSPGEVPNLRLGYVLFMINL